MFPSGQYKNTTNWVEMFPTMVGFNIKTIKKESSLTL